MKAFSGIYTYYFLRWTLQTLVPEFVLYVLYFHPQHHSSSSSHAWQAGSLLFSFISTYFTFLSIHRTFVFYWCSFDLQNAINEKENFHFEIIWVWRCSEIIKTSRNSVILILNFLLLLSFSMKLLLSLMWVSATSNPFCK